MTPVDPDDEAVVDVLDPEDDAPGDDAPGDDALADEELLGVQEPPPPPIDPVEVEPEPVNDRRIRFALLGLTVLGLVLRLAELGARPLHHDESIDANFSKRFIEGGYDGYDPVYHGPIRFYIEGGFFKLFGANPTSARLLAALAGTALIALPWFWRKTLGTVGTVTASAFLCLSPSFLYFTRFGREDAFFVLLTLAFFITVLALARRADPILPLVAGVLLVCAWALKESVLINLMVLGGFLLVVLIQQLLVATLRQRHPMGDPADLLGVRRGVLFGGMALFLFTFTYGERTATWVRGAGTTYICDPPRAVSAHSLGSAVGLLIVLLVGATAAAGVMARRRRVALADVPVLHNVVRVGLVPWLVAIGVSGLLFTGLFTTFFTNMDGAPAAATVDVCDDNTVNDTNPTRWSGVVDGLIGGFEYWSGEQETLRGDDRWFYYLVIIPAYEWFAVALAFVGIGRCLKRMTMLHQALVFWAVVAVATYSYAGERMPWLVIHPLLPIVMLAGIGVQVLWDHRREMFIIPAVAVGAVGVAYTLYASFAVSYHRGADAREMFVQAAQANQDVPDVVDRIEELNRISWAERGRPVKVGLGEEVYWLWWFYFQGDGSTDPAPQGVYLRNLANELPADLDTYDVLLVADVEEPLIDGTGTYAQEDFIHRVWWSETADWGDGGVRGWVRWLWDRRTWTPTEGLGGSVYVSNAMVDLERRAGRSPAVDAASG